MLDTTVSNTKSQLNRARTKIQKLLLEKLQSERSDETLKKTSIVGSAALISSLNKQTDSIFKDVFSNFNPVTPIPSNSIQQAFSTTKPVFVKSSMGLFGKSGLLYIGAGAVGAITVGVVSFSLSTKEIPQEKEILDKQTSVEKVINTTELLPAKDSGIHSNQTKNSTSGIHKAIPNNQQTPSPELSPNTGNSLSKNNSDCISVAKKNEPAIAGKVDKQAKKQAVVVNKTVKINVDEEE
jgi:hypothetical protein